jgi:intein/homing endonuclease
MKSSSVYNLVSHNNKLVIFFADSFYTNYREKKIPKEILNASREVKKSFINGVFASDGYGNSIDECSEIGMKSQVAMAGISLLIKEIGLPYKLKTRSDKEKWLLLQKKLT